jgi:hypothetical protein
MSEAKPVFVIRYPYSLSLDKENVIPELQKKMEDYHLLFVPTMDDEMKFECYNPKDGTDIDFKTLREQLLSYVAGKHS